MRQCVRESGYKILKTKWRKDKRNVLKERSQKYARMHLQATGMGQNDKAIMTFRFALNLRMFAYTALYNLISRCRPFFHCFFLLLFQSFFFFREPFQTVNAVYFIPIISRTDLWSQGIFCHDTFKLLPSKAQLLYGFIIILSRHFI